MRLVHDSFTDGAARPMISRAEILGAFSYALDITEGQPEGHCVRACWIACQIAQELGLPDEAFADLYYAVLLKDLGCSSNAARICELYQTDDRSFKRDFKFVTGDRPYRKAMAPEKALSIMASEVDKAIDRSCFEALAAVVAGSAATEAAVSS